MSEIEKLSYLKKVENVNTENTENANVENTENAQNVVRIENANTENTQNVVKVERKCTKDGKNRIKTSIYPFIDQLVDALNTDDVNFLIQQNVSNEIDKSIFLTYVSMFFALKLKLNDNDVPKQMMKEFLTNLIRNPETRSLCLQKFHNNFKELFIKSPKSEFDSIKHISEL